MTKTTLAGIATVVRGVSFDKSDVSDLAGNGLLPILRAGNIEVELDLRNDLVWVPSSKVCVIHFLGKPECANFGVSRAYSSKRIKQLDR